MTDYASQTEVIIAGGGLTGLTLAFKLYQLGIPFILLEKNDTLGGVIKTHSKNGFVYESGPNTGVLSTTEAVQLFESAACPVIEANPEAANRWILKNGEWQNLPSGLIGGIKTPLFRFSDKLRLLGEPFRKKGSNANETLSELVIRRMGKSFLDYAVDPFISGIYAGDPKQLVTEYAMPKLYRLEQDYGSFIKGAFAKARQPKSDLEKKVTKAVFSAKGGLQQLINAIATKLPLQSIKTSHELISVSKSADGFVCKAIHDGKEASFHSKQLVTTSGGAFLKDLFDFLPENALLPVLNLRYAKVVQIALGYNQWPGKQLNAFGGLIPEKENRDLLGVLFPSSIFEDRAPKQGALLSVFMGGIKRPELFELSDEKIRQIVMREVNDLFKLKDTKPDLVEIFRYKQAIPQYDISSKARLENISEIEKQFPGLWLAGNIRDGIGMADRIKQGFMLADEIQKNQK
jgi:oxygen-dependent protoporphyrinogen oxidase